ncbi:MAG: hypothetical protein Q4G44_08225 [Alcaligenaceae bacterium]|nr:hypothetical protein [Alcaligenaceae bacterium]
MSTFFRKRPAYKPRTEQFSEIEDDFPVVGPASEAIDPDHDDIPLLKPQAQPVDYPTVAIDDDDFPIVGPAAEDDHQEFHEQADEASKLPIAEPIVNAIPSTTALRGSRQFTPSDKIRLPAAPAWVQEQAGSYGISDGNDTHCELPKTIPLQLENAIQVIINNEMEEAERRIKQKVLAELKNYFEKQ